VSTAPRIFAGPELVRREQATQFLWGDAQAGFVSDAIYGRGERIAALVFTLRPGAHFGASATWKPIYDQHRFYYVVSGTLAIRDPESGEVAVARAGEAITWRGQRYHFGYNFGASETVVLDWYAPQERPPDVPELAVSAAKRELAELRPGRLDLLGSWPDARPRTRRASSEQGGVICVSEADALHLVHGEQQPLLVSVMASSPDLTAGVLTVPAGSIGEPDEHPGDEVLFALEGPLHVHLPETGDWFRLAPLDCVYLPSGTRHCYGSYGDAPARAAFCVAPGYR
jgi:mannose-6-phosphate isomerase-like protein (cupin superfamily)